MPKLANGLLVSIASGTQVLGPFNVPNNVNQFVLRLSRCTSLDPLIWPNESTGITVTVLASYDGGATYVEVGGFTASGGVLIAPDGAELAFTTMWTDLVDGSNRKVKAELGVTNGPLVTNATLEVN